MTAAMGIPKLEAGPQKSARLSIRQLHLLCQIFAHPFQCLLLSNCFDIFPSSAMRPGMRATNPPLLNRLETHGWSRSSPGPGWTGSSR